MRGIIGWAVIIWVIAAWSPGHAFQIEIEDHTISVAAERVPLHDLLRKVAIDHDVTVRVDPTINPRMTMSFQKKGLENGLKTLLQSLNYVLIWKSNPPKVAKRSAPDYRLSQIHIFKPGEKDEMVDINPTVEPAESVQPVEPLEIVEPDEQTEEEFDPQSGTPVTIQENKVFVPVTLGYGDREVRTSLLFDTGASSIVLHTQVAEELGIEESEATTGIGVGGVEIDTQKTELSYVVVGPNRKENLRADIVAYDGPEDEAYNGLLGMNFLRGLKYTIDFDKKIIQWMP